MAGSKFQYDESGSTFFYFLLSFEALVVIPCTYYLYPRNGDKHGQKLLNDKNLCHCENCRIKHSTLSATKPWKNTKERLIKFLLIIAWLALFLTAYKCCNLQHDYVAYDPFEILEIEPEASMSEIKKAYRRLSLVYHPDKSSGNEMKFMMLTKAYAALTDDEARKNWEMYGNPDGPGAMSFGIALPSWIIEKENSVWVLGLYALVFMVAMPVAVGIWWHRSVKFGTDAVLLDTTQLYLYFLYKSPRMIFRRIIMVIAASMEFRKSYNAKINERASDNVEVPQLIKQLPNIDYKNIEKPLCFSYSLKARALIHAHLSRLKLPARTLDEDRLYIVKKLPNLIHEFVQCSSQLTMLALSGRISRMPHLDTMESAMRLSQCIVQALWEHKSPFLQLPHITDDILRHFTSRRRNIRSIKNLASMKGSERRAVLRSLTDDEYDNVMTVLSKMPVVDIEVKSEVIDDEDACTITAGALVTVTVTLHRRNLSMLFDNQEKDEATPPVHDIEDKQPSEIPNGDISPKLKKQPKLVKGKKKKAKGGKNQILKKRKVTNPVSKAPVENKKSESVPETKESSSKAKDSDRESEAENEVNTDCESGSDENEAAADSKNVDDNGEDDAEWEKLQSKVSKRDKVLGTKSKKSHTVHCPFFPTLKDEYWWLYIADKRKHVLKTAPFLVTSLVSTEEVELKFTAPSRPGLHTYSVILRSDSYFDVDVIKTIKLDVKEAMEIDLTKLQWDVSENEEEKDEEESAVEDSDLATDDEVDDD